MLKDEITTTQEKTQETRFPGDLRDYFAGQALAGLNASYTNTDEWPDAERTAQQAFRQADAMLNERAKHG